MKKNNKGFSLVELIVVVLIMAILAVALTPQVMKWVGNSRISADVQTQNSIVAAIQIALTDSSALTECKTKYHKVTVNNSDTALKIFSGDATKQETAADDDDFGKALLANLDQPATAIKGKSQTFSIVIANEAGGYKITTDSTLTTAANTAGLK